MRKLFIAMLLACGGTVSSQAQEVYSEVLQMAKEKIESPSTPQIVKDINQFKVNALNYLGMKTREVMPDAPVSVLDDEAYALHNFIGSYLQAIVATKDQPKAFQNKVMQLFVEASIACPLFNDTEKETTLYYFNNSESLTRFSLDTDWVKAFQRITESLKELQQQ